MEVGESKLGEGRYTFNVSCDCGDVSSIRINASNEAEARSELNQTDRFCMRCGTKLDTNRK